MPIEVIPTGAALGAEIRGVDLAQPFDDAIFAAIERAFPPTQAEIDRNPPVRHPIVRTHPYIPGASAFMSCGTIAPGSRAWSPRKPRR